MSQLGTLLLRSLQAGLESGLTYPSSSNQPAKSSSSSGGSNEKLALQEEIDFLSTERVHTFHASSTFSKPYSIPSSTLESTPRSRLKKFVRGKLLGRKVSIPPSSSSSPPASDTPQPQPTPSADAPLSRSSSFSSPAPLPLLPSPDKTYNTIISVDLWDRTVTISIQGDGDKASVDSLSSSSSSFSSSSSSSSSSSPASSASPLILRTFKHTKGGPRFWRRLETQIQGGRGCKKEIPLLQVEFFERSSLEYASSMDVGAADGIDNDVLRMCMTFASKSQRRKFWELLHILQESEKARGGLVSSQQMLIAPITERLSVFASTWNMENETPPDTLDSWIPRHRFDIYAIAVQECNVDGGGGEEESSSSTGGGVGVGSEQQKVGSNASNNNNNSDNSEWMTRLSRHLGPTYERIASVSLWHIRLAIFAHKDSREKITNVHVASKITESSAIFGAKGAAAVSLQFNETKLLFINSNVSSHEDSPEKRLQHLSSVLRDLNVGERHMGLIPQFHHVLWLGDLNTNFSNMTRDEVTAAVAAHQWDTLYPQDAIRKLQLDERIFVNFKEQPPLHPPSYIQSSSSSDPLSSYSSPPSFNNGSPSTFASSSSSAPGGGGGGTPMPSLSLNQGVPILTPPRHMNQHLSSPFSGVPSSFSSASLLPPSPLPLPSSHSSSNLSSMSRSPSINFNAPSSPGMASGMSSARGSSSSSASSSSSSSSSSQGPSPTSKSFTHHIGEVPPDAVPGWHDRILWHSLPDCDATCSSIHHVASISHAGRCPISGFFTLQTLVPFVPLHLGAYPNGSCHIKLIEMRLAGFRFDEDSPILSAQGLSSSGKRRLEVGPPDAYACFRASFLENAVNTSVAFKEAEPSWKEHELPILTPFTTHREFLKTQHLYISLMDYDALSSEDRILGETVVSLKDACVLDPVTVTQPMILDGETKGVMELTFHVVWPEEINPPVGVSKKLDPSVNPFRRCAPPTRRIGDL